jgi:hypothetical protein
MKDFIVITLGTGVGSDIVSAGSLWISSAPPSTQCCKQVPYSKEKPKKSVLPVLPVHGVGADGTDGTCIFWIRQLYYKRLSISEKEALSSRKEPLYENEKAL